VIGKYTTTPITIVVLREKEKEERCTRPKKGEERGQKEGKSSVVPNFVEQSGAKPNTQAKSAGGPRPGKCPRTIRPKRKRTTDEALRPTLHRQRIDRGTVPPTEKRQEEACEKKGKKKKSEDLLSSILAELTRKKTRLCAWN